MISDWYLMYAVYDLEGKQSIPWKGCAPRRRLGQRGSHCLFLKSCSTRITEKQAGWQTEFSFLTWMYVQGWGGAGFYIHLGIWEYLLQVGAHGL